MLLRLGAVPTLVVSSPSAAQGSSDVAFSPYGEHWQQMKKIATIHLLSNRKVRSYRYAREEEVRSVMAQIHQHSKAGTAVDLSDLLNTFANDVANSSLIGGFNLEDYFPVLVKLDVVKGMVCAKAQKVHKAWDDLLEKLIDDHANRLPSLNEGGGDDDDSDFIDVLLSIQEEYKLTREHIKAQLEIMFEAGTDTSFIVLEYAMVELMQNPLVMTKLQAEVRSMVNSKLSTRKKKDDSMMLITEDELTSSRVLYLKAVIKETLRLHVPAPLLVPHLSMADCDVQGFTIPAGTRAIINGWALARDPDYWDSPEEFMPDRFMVEQGGSAAAMDYKGNNFLYMPFGTGRRICPGINFAISAIEVMLANLVCHFDWELPTGVRGIDMMESFGLTVHRTEKLLLVPKECPIHAA
ncbi:hypothetical protein PR202_gb12636 [Eleusine coracana subsp. coracana]|uniref:Uncharacterized protein n=1 Tax=Eleusine coracana subsp. coracana TaxID=191504 RepID=A0AAV5EQI6_ELECO|nr:hypothetical protein PR202_gb12636 [Eleusine coracana subsp. coracana]